MSASRFLSRFCAETATIWNGYMEGAVRSGRRAAAAIETLL